jgi:hypothetical protein
VLAAVQASVLRTDRSAAAGLDRVCAQRLHRPLRDGRQVRGWTNLMACCEFGSIQARDAFSSEARTAVGTSIATNRSAENR